MNINELRLANRDASTLLQNWVEERQTRHLDPNPNEFPPGVTSKLQIIKHGHKGVLTTDFNSGSAKDSTYTSDYIEPPPSQFRDAGDRSIIKEKFFYEKAANEIDNAKPEGETQPEILDYSTEFGSNFNTEFQSKIRQPTTNHDFMKDQPATFWTCHKRQAHGVSQVKTGDTPFRKNTAFSKPIAEHWNQTQPYDFENYPKM